MAKRISDKERVIAFFTTASEQEVKDALETVNVIAAARGFGKKRKAATDAKATGTRQRKSGKTGDAAQTGSNAPPATGASTAGSAG